MGPDASIVGQRVDYTHTQKWETMKLRRVMLWPSRTFIA